MSADGVLRSGTERELFASVLDGSLPADHPIFRPGWPEWLPLAEAVGKGFLENPTRPQHPVVAQPRIEIANPWIEEEVTLPRPPSYRRPVFTQSSSEPPPGVAHSIPPARQPIALPAVIGSSVALAGAVAGIAILALGRLAAPPPELRSALTSLPTSSVRAAPAPAKLAGCRAVGSPLSVSERVAPLASIFATSAGPGRIAVGVASSEKSGFGFEINLDAMRVEKREVVADPIHLSGIARAPGVGESFVGDRWWTTLPSEPSFAIGLTRSGFSRIASGGEQHAIWPGDAAAIIARPTIARASSGDFAVAFRRGDRTSDGYEGGSIRFGWITAAGERRSELIALYDDGGRVELPSVAASETGVLVAFASRALDDGALWRVSLANAAVGALPSNRHGVELGSGKLSERAVSVAATGAGRYVAVFAEGDRNQSAKVRLRSLDERAPSGAPVTLFSSADAVRATEVHVSDGRGAVLFTEKTERSFDRLWAIALDCR